MKWITRTALSFALAAVGFTSVALADTVQLRATITDVTTAESTPLDGDRTLFKLDQKVVLSVNTRDIAVQKRPPFRALAGQCFADEIADNATGGSVSVGECTYIDEDGDLIFEDFEIERASLLETATGIGIFTGGTGKYATIRGRVRHTRRLLLPPLVDGFFPGIGKLKGWYRVD